MKHSASQCKFKDAICRQCEKRGHIARACRSKLKANNFKREEQTQSSRKKQTHKVTVDSSDEEETEEYSLFNVGIDEKRPCYAVTPNINGVDVTMEIDTGAAVSVISEKTYKELVTEAELVLQPTNVNLRTYTGERIAVLG